MSKPGKANLTDSVKICVLMDIWVTTSVGQVTIKDCNVFYITSNSLKIVIYVCITHYSLKNLTKLCHFKLLSAKYFKYVTLFLYTESINIFHN